MAKRNQRIDAENSSQIGIATIPASVEALSAILDHYGFDHFFERTLRMIPLDSDDYADAVDTALERQRDDDLNNFSLKNAFRQILEDTMEEQDCDYEEALQAIAEEDFEIPADTAMYYSVDAGETDVEYLSTLIRNRARRLLRQHAKRQKVASSN